ncbi:MAG: hypothetical protein H7641_10560, partial [Candidatus Heimdallarchaeota archaeon]|nr:hypothetical protein [Candidatus Heimdallarchaeota archaeon]MCK4878003.1 hypothetical protein [Candidatus Heimdallarchaeota archaeon]
MGSNKKEEKKETTDKEVIDSESIKYLTSDATKPVIFKALELMVKNLQENIDHMTEHYEYVQQIRDRLMEDIKQKKRIYILASGRSAMVGQMLQTRLEHFGVESRFITNTRSVPRLKE